MSGEAVAARVLRRYGLTNDVRCRFYVLGLHDNFLVEDASRRYILRIYRGDWRSEDEIRFELELLEFLASRGVSVAGPVPARSGALYVPVEHAEGRRYAALFPFAPGVAPEEGLTAEQSRSLGELVARVHREADGFRSSAQRQVLDLEYLLDASIETVAPFVSGDDLAYLRAVQGRTCSALPALQRGGSSFVVCIGDVNPTNFHVDPEGRLTLFDFDQCGCGWRAFDVGKFFSTIRGHGQRGAIEAAFLAGYQSVSSLGPDELASIPWFVRAAVIWVMAIQVYNAERIGYKWLDEGTWKRRVERLRAVDLDLA
jgi:Ser/Thr protein kinase RdoA (MazF antagonist)